MGRRAERQLGREPSLRDTTCEEDATVPAAAPTPLPGARSPVRPGCNRRTVPRPLGRTSCTTGWSDLAFTLQMVVTTGTGRTVGILETRRLNATTLADAKLEADRRVRRLRHAAFAAVEILDDRGTVVARRNNGERAHVAQPREKPTLLLARPNRCALPRGSQNHTRDLRARSSRERHHSIGVE